MNAPVTGLARGSYWRTALPRFAAFFLLWVVLMQSAKSADIAFGAFAATAATWASLRLLPPVTGRVRLLALAGMLPYFLRQSVVAAFDIARRALAPRVRLAPGFVSCPLQSAPGLARNTLATITSLLPGSVPADEIDGVLVYHALDVTQPVAQQLLDTERRFSPVLVAGRRHD
jgi:multicomponent Na+:H+ antiporter subunit E